MDFEQFVERFGPYLEHIKSELEDVEKAGKGIARWQHRYQNALGVVDNHIKHCAKCMSLMINTNTFIPLEEWWEISHKMGLCDHPKERYMQN